MGNQITKKVSFQDIQYAQTNDHILIINTLPENEQQLVIYKTVLIQNEIAEVERAIQSKNTIIMPILSNNTMKK